MINDSPTDSYSIPLLDKKGCSRGSSTERGTGNDVSHCTNGVLGTNEVGSGIPSSSSSSSQRHEETSGLSSGSSPPSRFRRADRRLVPLDPSQKLSLHIRPPEDDSPAFTTISASDQTDGSTGRIDGRRRTSSRLSTFVPEGLRHSLGRIPTLVHLNSVPLYGEKTIGQLGSFIYLVNQIFGAGILALPYVVKVSGWLPSFFANLLVCLVAMFGTLMIMRCMTMIPGNQNFERRIEYIPTVEYFLGKKFRFWTELCFYLSIQSLNVVSIAVVAQSLDHLLLRAFGMTIGIVLDPSQSYSVGIQYFHSQDQVDHIYSGGNGLIFGVTFGYLINAVICIMLSTQTMDENMKIQYVSFAFLITSVLQISAAAGVRIWHASSSGAFLQSLSSFFHSNNPNMNPWNLLHTSSINSQNLTHQSPSTASSIPHHFSRSFSSFRNATTPFLLSSLILSSSSPKSDISFSHVLPSLQPLIDSSYFSSLLPSSSSSQSSHSLPPFFESFSHTQSSSSPPRHNHSFNPSLDHSNIYNHPFVLHDQPQSSQSRYDVDTLPSIDSLHHDTHVGSSAEYDSSHSFDIVSSTINDPSFNAIPAMIYKRRLQASQDLRTPSSLKLQNVKGVASQEPSSNPSSSQELSIAVRPPALFGQYQYGQLLSTFIASYSYVNVIPSWANEMTPGVRVNEAVWLSSAFSCVVYYTFGFLLAYAYPTVHTDNILQEVLADEATGVTTKFFIYIFNLLTVLPGILVYSITTRYNLVNSNQTTPRNGFIIGCIVPFAFAWLLANDEYFSAVLQWSSLLFSLAVNFVIPSVVYVTACGTQRLATRNPTRHFQTMRTYASRAKRGVNNMVDDVSAQLRDYLRSLPSAELDPYVRLLLNQQPSPTAGSPRHSVDFMPHPYLTTSTPPKSPRSPGLLSADAIALWPSDTHLEDVRTPSEERHRFGSGWRCEGSNETILTTSETPVPIWTTEPSTSTLLDHHMSPTSQHALSSTSNISPRSLSSAPTPLLDPSFVTEGPPLQRSGTVERRYRSPPGLERPRRSSVPHLDPRMIEQILGRSPYLSRPRSFSVKIPSGSSFEKTIRTQPFLVHPNGRPPEDIQPPDRTDSPPSSPPKSVTAQYTIQHSDPTLLNKSTSTLQEPSPPSSVETLPLPSTPNGCDPICEDHVHCPNPISVSITEPRSPLRRTSSESPSFHSSSPQQQSVSSPSRSVLSPPLSPLVRDGQQLPPSSTLSSISEDSAAANAPLYSLSTTQAREMFKEAHHISVDIQEEVSPVVGAARRFGTAPVFGGSKKPAPKRSKQVRFGRSDSHEGDDGGCVTFERLSSRVMEILNESQAPKEPPKRKAWKDYMGPFLTSSFSFSKSRASSSFDDESKSSRSLTRHFGTLDSSMHGASSATNRFSILRGQTVGFGSSPFFHNHDDDAVEGPSPFKRCQSFSPASRESTQRHQTWKGSLKRGKTLLVPGSGEAPSITITPTQEPTPKLAPCDVSANPLLRLVSSELSPASSVHSSASPAMSLLSHAATFDGASFPDFLEGRTSYTRGRRSHLDSVGECSEGSASTINFCGSVATRHSSRHSSWDGPITHRSASESRNADGDRIPSFSGRDHLQQEHPRAESPRLVSYDSNQPDGSTVRRHGRLPTCLIKDLDRNLEEVGEQQDNENDDLTTRLPTLPLLWGRSHITSEGRGKSPMFGGASGSECYSPLWGFTPGGRSGRQRTLYEFNSNSPRTSSAERSPKRRALTSKTLGSGLSGTNASRTFLAPPPTVLSELPVEPPIDLMVAPVEGAEDAYECDEEPMTRDLKPIRIHVFPKGPLRTHHLVTTRVLMGLLVSFCVLSAGSQIVVDILQYLGKLPQDSNKPSDASEQSTAALTTRLLSNPLVNLLTQPLLNCWTIFHQCAVQLISVVTTFQ